ncbi:alpha-ribazole phosphatase [Flavobacterium sp. F-65]|jgi:alpha-ribazole phosphatase|uniref:Alpha-ribazole phosphatase n=1 Tax=Flavobacterium pisciphilum TaxID=2893755 RepID=A0ABS8MRV8_9FLAO|nr:alpha-ribazole phosphatase [Flavobacterium sp. F-65]MCC9071499.1 alpha-ribazole phosphatase [Flavobacterium sp. F-65]
MEIYLVRHTETVCEKGICYGQTDVDIATPYNLIFENIAQQLPQDALLYSSPLKRCVLLAKHIQKQNDITNYKEDNRLMEMNFGDWEMKNWNEISQEDLNPWMEDFVNVRVPDGESFVDLHKRVSDFIENEIHTKTPQKVIIVAHAGVVRSILCLLNSLPLKDAFQNKVDFGQVIKIII